MCHLFAFWPPEWIEQIRELAWETCADRPEYLAKVEVWLDEQYQKMPPWLRPQIKQKAPF